MSTALIQPIIRFPEGFKERMEMEMTSRGYLSSVMVQLGEEQYRLFFYDPTRMQQDLEEETKLGRCYLAEPNLVLLPEITTENIEKAILGLCQNGYFQHLKPVEHKE